MSYTLSVHPLARRDTEAITDYIGERSPEGLLKWLTAYYEAQDRIASEPYSFAVAPDDLIIGLGIRQALFKTPSGNLYRAVFAVDDQAQLVTILRVLGPGQRPLAPDDLPNG